MNPLDLDDTQFLDWAIKETRCKENRRHYFNGKQFTRLSYIAYGGMHGEVCDEHYEIDYILLDNIIAHARQRIANRLAARILNLNPNPWSN